MLELLRDDVWQFVGFFVPFVMTVISTIVTWSAARHNRRISYRVTSVTSLLSPEMLTRLQILHDGQHLRHPLVASIEIANTGKAAIRSSDYESDLKIKVDDRVSVIACDVVSTRPIELPVQAQLHGSNEILVRPVLLNRGDRFVVEALLDITDMETLEYVHLAEDAVQEGIAESIQVSGRVADARILASTRRRWNFGEILLWVLNPFVWILVAIAYVLFSPNIPVLWKIAGLIVIASAALIFLVDLVKGWTRKVSSSD